MSFYACMLDCVDGTIYTGHSENLEARLRQHETGFFPRCYTFKRRPISLLWAQEFAERLEALEAEKRIKGWTASKKRALAASEWEKLSILARNRTEHPVEQPSTGSGLR